MSVRSQSPDLRPGSEVPLGSEVGPNAEVGPASGGERTIWALALAPAAAVVSWGLGADPWHAIAVGVALASVLAAALAVAGAAGREDLSWRFREWGGPGGGRDDVAALAASLGSGWGYVGQEAEDRLRGLARRRLAREGLDLRSPADRSAIEARIGSGAYHTLVHEEIIGLRLAAVLRCLEALEALEEGRR